MKREIIAFLGDSLTDYINFREFFPEHDTRNYGVAGDSTQDLLDRLEAALSVNPDKIFILIGVNDVLSGIEPDNTLANIREIISRIQKVLPECRIYLETLLPVNSEFITGRSNKLISEINSGLAIIAKETHCTLIDTHKIFAENDELPKRFTRDGVHLNSAGNIYLTDFISRWVNE